MKNLKARFLNKKSFHLLELEAMSIQEMDGTLGGSIELNLEHVIIGLATLGFIFISGYFITRKKVEQQLINGSASPVSNRSFLSDHHGNANDLASPISNHSFLSNHHRNANDLASPVSDRSPLSNHHRNANDLASPVSDRSPLSDRHGNANDLASPVSNRSFLSNHHRNANGSASPVSDCSPLSDHHRYANGSASPVSDHCCSINDYDWKVGDTDFSGIFDEDKLSNTSSKEDINTSRDCIYQLPEKYYTTINNDNKNDWKNWLLLCFGATPNFTVGTNEFGANWKDKAANHDGRLKKCNISTGGVKIVEDISTRVLNASFGAECVNLRRKNIEYKLTPAGHLTIYPDNKPEGYIIKPPQPLIITIGDKNYVANPESPLKVKIGDNVYTAHKEGEEKPLIITVNGNKGYTTKSAFEPITTIDGVEYTAKLGQPLRIIAGGKEFRADDEQPLSVTIDHKAYEIIPGGKFPILHVDGKEYVAKPCNPLALTVKKECAIQIIEVTKHHNVPAASAETESLTLQINEQKHIIQLGQPSTINVEKDWNVKIETGRHNDKQLSLRIDGKEYIAEPNQAFTTTIEKEFLATEPEESLTINIDGKPCVIEPGKPFIINQTHGDVYAIDCLPAIGGNRNNGKFKPPKIFIEPEGCNTWTHPENQQALAETRERLEALGFKLSESPVKEYVANDNYMNYIGPAPAEGGLF